MGLQVVYFVDTEENYKDELCVYDESKYTEKEKLAVAINQQLETAGFLDYVKDDDPEEFNEIGRSLAYTGYAQCKEYEFGIEGVEMI